MQIKRFSFLIHILICVILSLEQVFILFIAPIIYIPLFFVIMVSVYLGLLEPRRGWVLAIIQIVVLLSGYWAAIYLGYKAVKPDEAQFAAHIMFFPSFVVSFLTGFLFRK